MSATLREVIGETQHKFRLDAEMAQVCFHTRSELTAGLRVDTSVRQHALVMDEPEAIGGGDGGPTPVEVLLAALAACQEITYKAYAAAMGIALERVVIELEGDIDLRGFFGVDESVRPGLGAIRGRVELTSSAPRARLDQLKAAVDSHCPVLDMLRTPVPVSLELTTPQS